MCDYLRMMTLGSNDPHEMETLMDEEIEVVPHEHSEVAHALQIMADGMPALGIVAAVLGVIKTMGSITEDRKSVVEGKSGSLRVDLGGRRTIKKKNIKNINH